MPEARVKKTKQFNERARYTQGFRQAVAASAITSATITLNSSAMFLLGIAVFPTTAILTTLGDTQVTLVVNNNTLLYSVAANSLNPNFVQNMLFFPTPQPLQGNDVIQISFNKNDAAAVTVYTNVFYVPRIKKN
jgi:hypothetical protein